MDTNIDQNVYRKRASSKCRTINKCLALAKLDSSLKDQYMKSLQCSSVVFSNKESNLISYYCGSIICNVCARIRIAKFINSYVPAIKEDLGEDDLQFVTLTAPTIPATELPKRLNDMRLVFSNISKLRHKKSGGFHYSVWAGIRKTECTYNIEEDKYHPHFHVVIKGEGQAKWLKQEWIKAWERRGVYCYEGAQKVIPADAKSFKELAKYVVKDSVFTHETWSKEKEKLISVEALDIMYRALKGRRTYQNFGTLKKRPQEEEDLEGLAAQSRPEGKEGDFYAWKGHDWVDQTTGEVLADYEPSGRSRKYLKNMFATDLDGFLEKHAPPFEYRKRLFRSPELKILEEIAYFKQRKMHAQWGVEESARENELASLDSIMSLLDYSLKKLAFLRSIKATKLIKQMFY